MDKIFKSRRPREAENVPKKTLFRINEEGGQDPFREEEMRRRPIRTSKTQGFRRRGQLGRFQKETRMPLTGAIYHSGIGNSKLAL